MAPRDTENNAYAKFWGEKQRALWYVMVFSKVVNWRFCRLLGMIVVDVIVTQRKMYQLFAFAASFCVEPADIWTSSSTSKWPSQE